MSSSSSTSGLRHRKTVQSTSSNNELGSSPGAGFLAGLPLPPRRSNKINDNAKETQFTVPSSIPHETRNAKPQLHDSKQIELTSIRRFRPLPEDLFFPHGSSQIATQKSFRPLNFEAPNQQLKSSVFSFFSRPVTGALSPPKTSVASTSSNAPIATSLTKGDGSKAFAYQPRTSEMHGCNKFDRNTRVKRFEHGVMDLKELRDMNDELLEIQSRKDALMRRLKEFNESGSQPCPEKVHETFLTFKKEREDILQCPSELVKKFELFRSRPRKYKYNMAKRDLIIEILIG